jgi:putative hydrolase of HD superfamily
MNFIEFALTIGKLKKLKRTGWVRYGIPDPESVADHSFRLTLLSLFLASEAGVDVNKVMKMSLIHELGESTIGDIVIQRGKQNLSNAQSKAREERKAIAQILSMVDGNEYFSIYDEYEKRKTKEAQFVYQLGKLEMALQAYEYEREHKIELEEFFESARSVIRDKQLIELLDQIDTLRKK